MIRAHIFAYNEADIIKWTIRHLLDQGVDRVHIANNWSTDDTANQVREFIYPTGQTVGKLWPVTMDLWPASDMPDKEWSLSGQLEALDAWAARWPGDWVIYCDADEIRRSLNNSMTLAQTIKHWDAKGYNVFDHTVETYGPRKGWDGSQNPEAFFTDRVDSMANKMPHLKVWKQPPAGVKIDRMGSGGHRIKFPGMKIAPEHLLLKHYPLRSAEHAARKIMARRARYSKAELQKGWHRQYDIWTP